jgi:alkylation response protein AidB-like acyl-CoA dehydrogenase
MALNRGFLISACGFLSAAAVQSSEIPHDGPHRFHGFGILHATGQAPVSGEDGFGFNFAMKTLNGGRIGIAAQALGIASGAYELALAYSKERKSFGKPIHEHQAIQFKLAEMATRIETARLLCYKAAWEKDNHMDYVMSAAMAKLHASDTAMWVTIEAVQVHGGYGFVKEFHVERLMRDAKITQIYEGTSEIQKMVIGRSITK